MLRSLLSKLRPSPIQGLDRFVKAQELQYLVAYSELTGEGKLSHWMWFIFPQRKGLGQSYNSEYYGLENDQEVREYVVHPLLGVRYFELVSIVHRRLVHENVYHIQLMGDPIDVMKLRSSLGTFSSVVGGMQPQTDEMKLFLRQTAEIAVKMNWTLVP